MSKEHLYAGTLRKDPLYVHAVRAGDTVYVCDRTYRDSPDVAVQSARSCQDLGVILEAAGVTFDDVVKLHVLTGQPEDFLKSLEASREPFPKGLPAATGFVAGSGANTLVVIDLVASTAPKQRIAVPGIYAPPNTAHAVSAGGTVYLSGQAGVDAAGEVLEKGSLDAQLERAMRNVESILKAAGGTLADVVRLITLTTSREDLARAQVLRGRYFPSNPPAVIDMVVPKAAPGVLVQVDAIAALPDGTPRRHIRANDVYPIANGSHAVKVGNTVYTSGLVSRGPDGRIVGKGAILDQITQVYRNLGAVLQTAGGSYTDLAMLDTYAPKFEHLITGRGYRGTFITGQPPASLGAVTELEHPDLSYLVFAIAWVE